MTNQQARSDYKASLETRDRMFQLQAELRFREYRAQVEALSAQYKAALLAGDGEAAEAARRAGVALTNAYYGVEV